jgi:hypothetical protein
LWLGSNDPLLTYLLISFHNFMTKNVIIGILVVIVVLVGGYFIFANNQTPVTDQSTTVAPVSTTETPTTPTSTVPPLTLSTPVVQTNASASASSSTVLLNGQLTPGGMLTTYWFDYGPTMSLGSKTATLQIGSGFSAISAPQYLSGLSANTTYYYRLSAHNNLGTVSGAIYTFQTNNSNPPLKAAMPTVRTNNASNLARNSATLNGQITMNGWQASYWFEYGKDNTFGSTTALSTVATSASLASASPVSVSVSGLIPLTKYYFRVNAQNQFGTVNGSTLSFTTPGPANPKVPNN